MKLVWALFLGLAFVLASASVTERDIFDEIRYNPRDSVDDVKYKPDDDEVVVEEVDGEQQNNPRADIPSSVHIYFLEDAYLGNISVPSSYPQSYQIPLSGLTDPVFKVVSGDSANVTSGGLIKPKGTIWYWKDGFGTTSYMEGAEVRIEYEEGITKIKVTSGDFTQTIEVNVTNYAYVYAEDKMNSVLREIAPSSLTPLQKLQNITKWVAHNTDYCVYYQGYVSMLIFQCGDCWASTNTIVAMGKRVGLDIKSRRGNQESGAGSGHKNALAIIDDRFYVGEAGYTGKRPRGWHVRELPLGFAMYGSYIVQYDGYNSTITIPSRLGTTNVTGLGRNADVDVFMHSGYLKSLSIPAEIKYIASGIFSYETNLTKLTVDPKSEYFETVDNVLYSKWKTRLIFTPTTKTSVKIPENTTVISTTALSRLNLKTLVIPSNVKTLELAALFKSTIGRLKIEYGVETINETVFNRLTTPKIILPDSVKFLGLAPFYYVNTSKVVLSKNITEIPRGCFQYSNITTLNIPSGVKTIGESAFSSCSKLQNITIPVSVTSVGKNAFSYTKNLTDIYYTGTEEQWNKITFATAIPDGKTIHFNSIPPEDEVDDEPIEEDEEITSNVAKNSEEDAGFPLWATITCSVVGAALIVGVIILAVFLAKKKKGSSKPSQGVEMGSVRD